MSIKQAIKVHLSTMKKATITLEDLESLFDNIAINAHEFRLAVLELEQECMLESVKTAGRTVKQPSVAYRYRINKPFITEQYNRSLQQYRLELHPAIQLDSYFSLTEQQFIQDKPWIDKIDLFLKKEGLPVSMAPAPERSFQLTGNEKWITDLGGEGLLRQLQLWEELKIHPVSDPLMLAINPFILTAASQSDCLHLIVENKTTFQALLPVLSSSSFHTLIYGCGNKITGNFDMFSMQYPMPNCNHHFFYFGDLDFEGIRIWSELNKRHKINLALPFYEACLSNPFVLGKSNQRANYDAVENFIHFFGKEHQVQIKKCLDSGGYYPQEILSTQRLQQIWRSQAWEKWINLN